MQKLQEEKYVIGKSNLLYVQVLARLRIRASGCLNACAFNKDYQLL
jgi:hypothetical protein